MKFFFRKIVTLISFCALFFFIVLPQPGFAQTCPSGQVWDTTFGGCVSASTATVIAPDCKIPLANIADMLCFVSSFIYTAAIPLVMAIATLVFVGGTILYLTNPSDEAKREKGTQFMTWGIIGLTATLIVWGIVQILFNTLGFKSFGIPQLKEKYPYHPSVENQVV